MSKAIEENKLTVKIKRLLWELSDIYVQTFIYRK